jgi:hypothetical protein
VKEVQAVLTTPWNRSQATQAPGHSCSLQPVHDCHPFQFIFTNHKSYYYAWLTVSLSPLPFRLFNQNFAGIFHLSHACTIFHRFNISWSIVLIVCDVFFELIILMIAYAVKSKCYAAPEHAVISSILSLHPSLLKIFPLSIPFSVSDR